jgi:YjbE family integral membrane protein
MDMGAIAAYAQIVMINLVLSGDNVIVIGLAAAGLPAHQRGKAIVAGIGAAAVIRIVFAVAATQLLAVPGLLVAGAVLLFWVCWNMFSELRRSGEAQKAGQSVPIVEKTLFQAVRQIILADVSMSLDNVLAVAGAAKNSITTLVFGLLLSVVLMAVASSLIARVLARWRWIAWFGLAVIVYVAVQMLYGGVDQVVGYALPLIPLLKG